MAQNPFQNWSPYSAHTAPSTPKTKQQLQRIYSKSRPQLTELQQIQAFNHNVDSMQAHQGDQHDNKQPIPPMEDRKLLQQDQMSVKALSTQQCICICSGQLFMMGVVIFSMGGRALEVAALLVHAGAFILMWLHYQYDHCVYQKIQRSRFIVIQICIIICSCILTVIASLGSSILVVLASAGSILSLASSKTLLNLYRNQRLLEQPVFPDYSEEYESEDAF